MIVISHRWTKAGALHDAILGWSTPWLLPRNIYVAHEEQIMENSTTNEEIINPYIMQAPRPVI